MKGYSGVKVFLPLEQEIFEDVTELIEALPEHGSSSAIVENLRCHEVARAVALWVNKVFVGRLPESAKVVDGLFGHVEHSWVVLSGLRHNRTILDPYSVGRLPVVQLLDSCVLLPYHELYRMDFHRTDIQDQVVEVLLEFFNKRSR